VGSLKLTVNGNALAVSFDTTTTVGTIGSCNAKVSGTLTE
jgi:hypothetical protein